MTLTEVHLRICKLEEQRRLLYRDRCRAIHEFSLRRPLDMLPTEGDGFKLEIGAIEIELEKLWELKRALLKQLRPPSGWSWLSPVILPSEELSVALPMFAEVAA